MKFSITRHKDGFEACYSEDEPAINQFGRPYRDDRYRVGASQLGSDSEVRLIMQHLKLSDPPYNSAEMPGRMVDMTMDEFSQYVDELVALRDRLRSRVNPPTRCSSECTGGRCCEEP